MCGQNIRSIFFKYNETPFIPVWENEIHNSLEKLGKESDLSQVPEFVSELYAFGFFENYKEDLSYWGTYFEPLISHVNKDQIVDYEYPSLKKITEEMIDYWEKRGDESTHPVLISRYYGLVWDLSKKIKGKNAGYHIAEKYLNGLLSTVNQDLFIQYLELKN